MRYSGRYVALGKIALMLAMVLALFYCGSAYGQTWEDLLSIADSLYEAQEYGSAVEMAERALEKTRAEFGGDDVATAKVLHWLGMYHYYDMKDYTHGEFLLKQSLDIREKKLGPEHPDIAATLRSLGNLYRMVGRLSEAEVCLGRALDICEKTRGPEDPDILGILTNLGYLRFAQCDFVGAEQLHKKALAIKKKVLGPRHASVGVTLSNLAGVYDNQGRYERAVEYHTQALSIIEDALGPHHRQTSVSLRGLADALTNLGDYASAEPLYRRVLAIREEIFGPDHELVAEALNGMGLLCHYQGRFEDAESAFERSLAILSNRTDPPDLSIARVINNLSDLHADQGRYAEAESLQKQALVYRTDVLGPDHPSVATSLCKLARLYAKQGNYVEAERLHRQALDIREASLGPEHPDVAESVNALGAISLAQRRLSDADSLLNRALAIREASLSPEHPYIAETLEPICTLYRLVGDGMGALEAANRTWMIRRRSFAQNAVVLTERNALTSSQSLRKSLHNLITCYFELEPALNVSAVSVINAVLSTKGQVSDEIFDRRRSLAADTDSGTLALDGALSYARLQLSKLIVEGPGENTDEYCRELDSLNVQAENLEAELCLHSARYRQERDRKNVSADRLISLLPENSVLIEYLKYEHRQLDGDSAAPRYVALILRRHGDPVLFNLGDASEIDALVDEYRRHMMHVSKKIRIPEAAVSLYKQIAQKVYERAWQPFEKYLSGEELVFIAPDGALNLVSFAGLMDNDGRYLIEKFAPHYLTAGRDIIRFSDSPRPGIGLFAMGDPDFDAAASDRLSQYSKADDIAILDGGYEVGRVRSGSRDLQEIYLSPLPATRTEVERIRARWSESTKEPVVTYFGTEATERRFKVEAQGNRVIHLATHGYFLDGGNRHGPGVEPRGFDEGMSFGENPLLLSGLFLAGANLHGAGSDSLGAEDGILTAYEVTSMNLVGTDLVVLSACETGLGALKEGEGVYGLRRAFQMAGARTVISALWQASDKSTAEIMGRLYDRADELLPETMRRLQLEMIRELRAEGEPDHPFSWAAFICVGDWR